MSPSAHWFAHAVLCIGAEPTETEREESRRYLRRIEAEETAPGFDFEIITTTDDAKGNQ